MPTPSIGKFSERIQFFDGQRLFASDLQDLEQFNREMRRLHNQSLHQAGVASGYAVSGNKDDREVVVQPGYALDSSGREIVLTEPLVLQVPPVADDGAGRPAYYDLIVSYPIDAELTENRAGVCVSRGAVRLREEPIFCWAELSPTDEPPGPRALDDVRQAKLASLNDGIKAGLRIRLARAEVFNCKLNQPLSIAQRRNARPVPQPYMVAGRSPPGGWTVTAFASSLTLSRSVDTNAAQFRSPPRYFAHVIGERHLKLPQTGERTLDGFWRPDPDPTAKSFAFTLFIPSLFFAPGSNLAEIEKIATDLRHPESPLNDWYVEWLGVEG